MFTWNNLKKLAAISSLSLALCAGAAGCSDDEEDAPATANNSAANNNPANNNPANNNPANNNPANNNPANNNPANNNPANNNPATLYEQLGGEQGVRAVLAEFVGIVGADDRINWMFANTDLAQLQDLLHEQVCAATGGGCTYTGRDMKTAHEGMAITNAQFDALIEDFLMALDNLNVPYSPDLSGGETIDPLLVALVGMKGDIVEDPEGDEVYFNQLGGYGAVSAVIDGMLTNVAADERINFFFADTDLAMLRQLLIEQVCEATGGFCVYSGRSMVESHTGLNITDDHFNALVEDLLMALDTLGVGYSAEFDGSQPADVLLQTLAGLRGEIVGL